MAALIYLYPIYNMAAYIEVKTNGVGKVDCSRTWRCKDDIRLYRETINPWPTFFMQFSFLLFVGLLAKIDSNNQTWARNCLGFRVKKPKLLHIFRLKLWLCLQLCSFEKLNLGFSFSFMIQQNKSFGFSLGILVSISQGYGLASWSQKGNTWIWCEWLKLSFTRV